MHSYYMTKDAAITIRLPAEVKRSLQARAQRCHRSISGQAAFDLERVLADEPEDQHPGGRFLGMDEGGPVPSDEDIREVRKQLGGRLSAQGSSRG